MFLFSPGNATAASEFNIHMDPEAAAVVFDSDSPDFDSGTLTVSFMAGSDALEDVLAIVQIAVVLRTGARREGGVTGRRRSASRFSHLGAPGRGARRVSAGRISFHTSPTRQRGILLRRRDFATGGTENTEKEDAQLYWSG